jgi:CRP/FNR family transcriptional regulator, anaerobic regulatory protein
MGHDLILTNIARHITLDKEEQFYFTSLLKEQQVPKKAFVLKEGQVCQNISFVHSGALRAYYSDKNGSESTIMFAVADWWVTDMFCFINKHPAMLNIEAIESSHIFQLQKEDLDMLYNRVPKFERYFRIIMQNAYVREQLRIIQNLSLSAEERYDNFISKYPHIATQVMQKHIASYLGITPEFLSTIRGNWKKR